MILIPFEGVDPKLLKVARGPIDELASFHDFFQEQRVGAIDNGQVDFTLGKTLLQAVMNLSELVKRRMPILKKDGQIHIAPRVNGAGHGGAELQDESNAIFAGEFFEHSSNT